MKLKGKNMSIEDIRRILNAHRQTASLNNKPETESQDDIYDLLKILDEYKKNDDIKKIYKTKIDYERDDRKISVMFKIDKFRRMNSFDYVLDSEFIKDMFNRIDQLKINSTFKKRIKDRKNYKVSTYGDTAIFRTPFFLVY
jgi:hypothetical protein